MDDELPSNSASVSASVSWTLISFSDLLRLGQGHPIDPELPLAADIAVIMYTSGSTGLPKVHLRLVCTNYLYIGTSA